jgi:ribosomal protein L7Ae-like RNA K-turn-binding protein
VGLAQRGGNCVSGAELCEKAIRDGRAKLLIIDSETRENTVGKFVSACGASGIPIIRLPGLGHAIGKAARKTCAITDEGLARAIEKKLIGVNPGGVVKE